MSSEGKQDRQLEIAHVLCIDIVGYSKLPINRQSELLQKLNQVVRATEQFRRADAVDKLVRLPTGDGMALAFFTGPDAPVRCALEISKAVGQALPLAHEKRRQARAPALQLRMGINSGPVDAVPDVNDRSNVAGAGINMAQRVMDCGDAGHILLAKRVSDDLGQYEEWQPYLHNLDSVEVKHGVRVALANFFGDSFGNPSLPAKVIQAKQLRRRRFLLWLATILLFLLFATVGFWIWTRRGALTTAYKTSVAGISDKSIAVLPFENLSADNENAFFSDGVQNEILTDLAKIEDLKVISRTSVLIYKAGAARNLRENRAATRSRTCVGRKRSTRGRKGAGECAANRCAHGQTSLGEDLRS